MSNDNITRELYQRLFPRTYAKNLKMQEISLIMCEKLKKRMEIQLQQEKKASSK